MIASRWRYMPRSSLRPTSSTSSKDWSRTRSAETLPRTNSHTANAEATFKDMPARVALAEVTKATEESKTYILLPSDREVFSIHAG